MTFSIETTVADFTTRLKLEADGYHVLKTLERPFSTVYKIRINPDHASAFTVYLKHYKARKDIADVIERDYNTTKFWWEKLKDSKQFRVIEPLYYNTKTAVIITRESTGADIRSLIPNVSGFFAPKQQRSVFFDKMSLVGRWLRHFQQFPLQHPETALSLEALKQYVQTRLDKIVLNNEIHFSEEFAVQIIAFIENQWAGVTEEDKRICYTHSDLSLSNVLVHEDMVTVLDFSSAETGSVFKDLTRFYHQCALLKNKPTISNAFVAQMMESFLTGYDTPEIRENPLFKIFLMTHTINHLGKTARYWEHTKSENIYNRWIVRNSLKQIRETIA